MDYEIKYSGRKTLSLSVKDGRLIVRAPHGTKRDKIDRAVASHEQWINKHIEKQVAREKKYGGLSEADIDLMRKDAKALIPLKVSYYANIMGLEPSSVRITSAKRSFGSCSAKNSLCFSLYLMLYSDRAIDYVVIHELAHIKHKNHGKEFYSLIEKYMPDYKEAKNELRK